MVLRNAIITEVNLSKLPNKPPVGSVKFRFDMTIEMAEKMGWDCLFDADKKITNGWDTLPLKGDLALVSAKFKPNKKTALAEITATTCSHFSAHRLKEADETRFYLAGIVRSADENFEAILGPYLRGLGEGGSQLTLNEAQANLFTGTEEKDAGDESLQEHVREISKRKSKDVN